MVIMALQLAFFSWGVPVPCSLHRKKYTLHFSNEKVHDRTSGKNFIKITSVGMGVPKSNETR